jgi:geranylgeranyl diphosphate synthase type I
VLDVILSRYLSIFESETRSVVASHLRDELGFGLMVRYAMGWVDQDDQPYHHSTGKRLRPILLLLCAEAAGGDWKAALPAAIAVELLHNFSLIHDDIQDASELRHGRPTLWRVWGIPNAINAGDAVFSLAYAALSDISNHVSPHQALQLWKIFNTTNLELTRGQHLDMSFETRSSVSADQYISMIAGKSAALLSACAQMGSLVADSDTERARHYASFGLNLGLAFQIRDDILGIWGQPSVTGKSAATDIISRKKSLPVLYGLSKSDALRAIYSQPVLQDSDVQRAVQILDDLAAGEYARQQESEYYQRAVDALSAARPSDSVKVLLDSFLGFLFSRQY